MAGQPSRNGPAGPAAAGPAAHTVALEAGELRRPGTSWPTVCLAGASLALWATAAWLAAARAWPWPATLPLSALAAYAAFTPMHDAAHGSVSRERRWLNEAVGWSCSSVFLVVPHGLFRFLHLRHHKHTNDPELDPDYIHCTRPALAIFQVWGVLLGWSVHLWRHCGSWPAAARMQSVVAVSVNLSLASAMWRCGLGQLFVQCWLAPALLAVSILFFVLSYVPHHPHEVTRAENLYGCTSTVGGLLSPGSGGSTRALTWLMLGQNYHSIHHLYPTLPFYMYAQVWRRHQDAFISAGVPVVALLRHVDSPLASAAGSAKGRD